MKRMVKNKIKYVGGMDARILENHVNKMNELRSSFMDYMNAVAKFIEFGEYTTPSKLRACRTTLITMHDTCIHKIDEICSEIKTDQFTISGHTMNLICSEKEIINIANTFNAFKRELWKMRAEIDTNLFRVSVYFELTVRSISKESADEYVAFIYDNDRGTWNVSIRYAAPEATEPDDTSSETEKSDDTSMEEFKEA